MDLISVVLITYNSEKTIIESLESIKNQTYPFLELIVSDDYSTDMTCKLVNKWINKNKSQFNDIKLVKTKINKGVTFNCNLGISKAKGKYIQLLAGDDILLPTALEEKYKYAEKNNLDIVFCKVEIFGNDRCKINEMNNFCNRGYKLFNSSWEKQYKNLLIDNFIAGPSGSFISKKLYEEIGVYDNRFPFLEDYPFLIKIMISGRRLYLLDKVLAKYRVSHTSLCTTNNKKFLKSWYGFFLKVKWKLLIKEKMYGQLWEQVNEYLEYKILKKR